METEKFKLKDIGYGLVVPILVGLLIVAFPPNDKLNRELVEVLITPDSSSIAAEARKVILSVPPSTEILCFEAKPVCMMDAILS